MLREFKEFAMKGNMIDLAVGIIIGGAFGTVVRSLVDDILTPLISGAFDIPDFSNVFWVIRNPSGAEYETVAAAREVGAAVIGIGSFVNALIAFLLMAWALFFIVKAMNKLKRKEAEKPSQPKPTDVQVLMEIRDILKANQK